MKQYPFEHQQFTSATYPGEKGSGNYHYRGFAGLYFVAYPQKKFQDFTSWYATSISKKASPGNPEKKIDRAPKEREQLRQGHSESLRERIAASWQQEDTAVLQHKSYNLHRTGR